jgi:excisionase family DNA binding protein
VNTDNIHDLASQLVEQVTARVLASQVPATTAQRKIEPRLLTVEQAAGYIGRSEQAVRHLIFQRDIPVVRTGRCVRIDRKDLDRWIENYKT